jgi:hypothetical protein
MSTATLTLTHAAEYIQSSTFSYSHLNAENKGRQEAAAILRQKARETRPQSKVGQYISCQTCHKPAGDQATKESGTCQDCRQAIITAGHAREADKDYGANNTTNTGVDGLLPALS